MTNHDVDVTANDVEIPTLRPTIDTPIVSTRSKGPKVQKFDESKIGSTSD